MKIPFNNKRSPKILSPLLRPGVLFPIGFTLAFYSLIVFAQPQIKASHLLFEAMPIPSADSDRQIFITPVDELPAFTAASQTPGPPTDALDYLEINRQIEQYQVSSSEAEADTGLFSNELKEDLLSLAFLYQRLGDHQIAINYYERSQNITRVNGGLENLDQLAIIEAMIPSYEAMNKHKEADDMQESLVYILQQAYGNESLEVVPALLKLGDWNIQAFLERSSILLNIERMNVQSFLDDPMNYMPNTGYSMTTPRFNLLQAEHNFYNSIKIIVQNKDFTHPQLLDLERKLRTTYFLRTHEENILYEPDFYLTRTKRKTGSRLNQNAIELMNSGDYRIGMASLQRSLAYIRFNPDSSSNSLARAMLEEADWDLLFERKVKAANRYQDIYDYFTANPELEASVSAILYPVVPLILPTYLPAPNSREKLNIPAEKEVSYLGYFDVSFQINRFGKTKAVRILSRSGEITRNMEIRFNQYLRKILFRPRFKDGESATDRISLRYYIAY